MPSLRQNLVLVLSPSSYHAYKLHRDRPWGKGGGGGQICFACSADSSSFCDFFPFFPQNKGGGHLASPLGLPTKLRIKGGAA